MFIRNNTLLAIRQIKIRRNNAYWKFRNWYAKLVTPKEQKPPYQHIVQVGDPRLRCVAEEIPLDKINTPEIQSLIHHMKTVFRKYNCIGLSAPQVGINYKIFIMEFQPNHAKQYSEAEIQNKEICLIPLTVVINPEIKITDFTQVIFSESCESVKGFWADVPRYRKLQLKGYNENTDEVDIEACGWTSRIIQHEIDHLNGILYTDIMNRKTLTCTCWQAVNERKGKVILPFSPD